MKGIRVLVLTLSIICIHHTKAEFRIGKDSEETKSKISLPENWRLPEKYLSELEPVIEQVPYLHSQKIKVKYGNLKTTMAMRPTILSVFRSRHNRHYVLRINNDPSFEGVLYKDVPPEARTGLWAHEMMHIRDYKNRGVLGVLFRGWQYLSKRGKIRFEREIDQMTIDAGFEEFLYEWTRFVLEDSQASPAYKAYKREIYLLPCEIAGDCDTEIVEEAVVMP